MVPANICTHVYTHVYTHVCPILWAANNADTKTAVAWLGAIKLFVQHVGMCRKVWYSHADSRPLAHALQTVGKLSSRQNESPTLFLAIFRGMPTANAETACGHPGRSYD